MGNKDSKPGDPNAKPNAKPETVFKTPGGGYASDGGSKGSSAASSPSTSTNSSPARDRPPTKGSGTGVLSGYSRADDKLTVDSFNLKKVLGRGSFGKVMLATKKDEPEPQKLYAMKVLKKAILVKRNQVTHTECERYILEHIKSPFLIELHFAFQTAEKLYMVMDFMAGGELFHCSRKIRNLRRLEPVCTRLRLFVL